MLNTSTIMLLERPAVRFESIETVPVTTKDIARRVLKQYRERQSENGNENAGENLAKKSENKRKSD